MKRVLSIVLLAILALSLIGCADSATQALDTFQSTVQTALSQEDGPTPEAEAPNEAAPAVASGDLSGFLSEDRLITLYEQANDSVVNIRVTGGSGQMLEIPGEGEGVPTPDPNLPEFPDVPGFPELPQLEPFQPFPQGGEGSGFVYDEEGHIITNHHVVAGAERIVVTFADGREAEATLVGTDPDSDLAVIQVDVEPDRLHPVTFADSESLRVGQFVVAIGNPFGLNGSMSVGIVSGLDRTLPADARTPSGQGFTIPDIIQTDTAINPGNSGGPLLTLDGQVIGVNTAIESPVRAFAGVGFAVPSNIVTRVVPDILDDGTVEHPWIGIAGTELGSDLAAAMDLDADQRGVLVLEIAEDSPAATSDLQGSDQTATIDGQEAPIGGDVIVAIDGQPVNDFDDLLTYIVNQTEVGQTVTLRVLREGAEQDIPITLGARPAADR
jgi:S1-C subfamily serine protease